MRLRLGALVLGAVVVASVPAAAEPTGEQVRVSQMGPDGNGGFDAGRSSVAYNPELNQYLVVWEGDDGTDGEIEIHGRLTDGQGNPIGAEVQLSEMGADGSTTAVAHRPDVVYNADADEYMVVWHGDPGAAPLVDNEFEVWFQRVEENGVEVGSDERVSKAGGDGDATDVAENATVAWNSEANEYLVAWLQKDANEGLESGEYEVFGVRLGSGGNPLGAPAGDEDFRISSLGPTAIPAAQFQNYRPFDPDVAYDELSNQYLAVYSGDNATDNEHEVYGRLVSALGAPQGADEFAISDMGTAGHITFGAFRPAVAGNTLEGGYLVAWEGDDQTNDEYEIHGQVLSGAGIAQGTNDFQISNMGPDGNGQSDAFSPTVAYNGTANEYLVAWGGDDPDGPPLSGNLAAYGQRVTGGGSPTGEDDFQLSQTETDANQDEQAALPAAAFNSQANDYLVTWTATEAAPTAGDDPYEIFARRSTAGTCPASMTVDAVRVFADCIERTGETEERYLASGNARLGNGTRIEVDGTGRAADLVVDPGAHRITLAPTGGQPTTGLLFAGPRQVAVGRFEIDTRPNADSFGTGIQGLVPVLGTISNVRLSLSGWGFLDNVGSLQMHLVPTAEGGGAIVHGSLALPVYYGSLSGRLSVQAQADGRRRVRTGELAIPALEIPNTPWEVENAGVTYLEDGDQWRGRGTFKSPNFGKLVLDPVVVRQGKFDELRATYDGTKCSTCGPTDPDIGSVLKLKTAELHFQNLSSLDYSLRPLPRGGRAKGGVLGGAQTGDLPGCLNCKPPEVSGNVFMTALKDRVLGTAEFRYTLGGEAWAHGHIEFAPLIPENFSFPDGVPDQVTSAADPLRRGLDFADATAHYKPPRHFSLSGYTTMLYGFLRGTFAIGIDPPHFTGEAGLELRIPDFSPIFPGTRIGGAYALLSDKAAAGKAVIRTCAPKWLGGGCISTSFSGALVWSSGQFKFFVDLDDYRTVDIAAHTSARRAPTSLRVPRGWELAAFRVRSRTGIPNVRLTSPRVRGRRLVASTRSARRMRKRSGAIASVSRRNHEVTFLVPTPPAGRWSLRRLGGPRITSARVSTREENAELEPSQELPEQTLSVGDGVPLSFEVENAARGTTVDLYADDDGEGADGFLIASDLPPRAATTWQLSGLATGRYHVYAIISRDGVPLESRYWPGAVDVVDPEAPAAPAEASAEPHERGARVRWSHVPGGESYSVIARPVPASAGEQIEETIPAGYDGYVMALEPGLRYEMFVQAIDGALRRSAERAAGTIAVTGAGDPPPAIGGEPNEFARVGEPWAFAPILSDLDGQRVRLRVVRGPGGMSASDGVVRWTPRGNQVGYTEFTLEAEDSAGGRTRRSFDVLVNSTITAPPPPPSGLTVAPAAVAARRGSRVTVSGQGFDRRTRVFAGRTRLRRIRVEDANTLTARVRCLRPGSHTISIRRGDGSRESLPRGLTVTGRRCRR